MFTCYSGNLDIICLVHINTNNFFISYMLVFMTNFMRVQGRTVSNSKSSQPWVCLSEFWKPPNTGCRLDSLLLKIVIKSVNISSVVRSPLSAEALKLAGQLLLFLLMLLFAVMHHVLHLCTAIFISLKICFWVTASFGRLYIPHGSGFVCGFLSV